MAATETKAPPKVASLGAPPKEDDVKGNVTTPIIFTQLNARMAPEKHTEIKIAAITAGMNLADYIILIHDEYQARKKGA